MSGTINGRSAFCSGHTFKPLLFEWNPGTGSNTDQIIDDGSGYLTAFFSTPSNNPPYYNNVNTPILPNWPTNAAYNDSPSSHAGGHYYYTAYVVCNDFGPSHGHVFGAINYTVEAPPFGLFGAWNGNLRPGSVQVVNNPVLPAHARNAMK